MGYINKNFGSSHLIVHSYKSWAGLTIKKAKVALILAHMVPT